MGINEKTLMLYALIFMNLGCIPAYFDFMFYAIALWIIGSAIMNISVFVISSKENYLGSTLFCRKGLQFIL